MKAQIHPLRRWLFENGMSQKAFRKLAAMDYTTLSLVLSYRRSPTVELAGRMAAATGGALKVQDFAMPEKRRA